MKKLFSFVSNSGFLIMAGLFLTTFSINVSAQNYHVIDTVLANPSLMGGVESPYRFIHYTSTPAPKGYKAFYIGHYGRHGSRYGWDAKMYTLIRDVFSQAKQENKLTSKGLDFWTKYKDFYTLPYLNTGDLTDLGWQQHQRIARELAKQYPEVFRKRARVQALSSTSGRCILSMGAFLTGLEEACPGIQVEGRALHQDMLVTCTSFAPDAIKQSFKVGASTGNLEPSSSYAHRIIPYDELAKVFFTDVHFLDSIKGGRTNFLYQMLDLLGGYHNYESKPLFDNFYTPQQLLPVWESRNYNIYLAHNKGCWQYIPLLHDFIDKAQLAILGKGNNVDLRFGHDHVFNPFMCLLNADEEQQSVVKPEDVKYWYQTYNTPMAATVLFVLYKNKKGDILFKVTRNGREITLPQLTSVSGPYYKWADFTQWADKIFQEHPLIKVK